MLRFRSLRALTLSGAALSLVGQAAALTLSNLTSDVTVVRPSVGTAYGIVSGTLTATPWAVETFNYMQVGGPYTTSEATLGFDHLTTTSPATIRAALASGNVYTGELFRWAISPTTPLGLYDRAGGGTSNSQFVTFGFASSLGTTYDAYHTYSVNVVNAVPEPSALAAVGLVALGLLHRRRKP